MAVVASIEAVEIFERPAAPRYELVLPFPPSVNQIWKWVGRKVIRSDTYEAWLKHCDGCVLDQLGVPAYRRTIKRRYTLTLTLDSSRFGHVDQDNCIKAVSDMLQRSRIIENDKWAWKTIIMWGDIESSHEFSPACHVSVEGI